MSGAKGDLVRDQVLVGDVRRVLLTIPDASIDTIVTSPPYFRLRNYQHGEQIGLEPHVDGWVNELLLVARGLKRVLKPTGSLWLNLGDTFSRSVDAGALPKSLLLAPERLALAM
jgi:site-specific DNA-methyltransferase (adenine-specific)